MTAAPPYVLDLLARNQGNILTPELVVGLAQSIEAASSPEFTTSVPRIDPPDPQHTASPRLVTDAKHWVGDWVKDRVGQPSDWSGHNAIGWLDPSCEYLTAGAVLENVTKTNATTHVAIDSGGISRTFIEAFFDYAFNQLGLERLTGYVDADNHAALQFDTKLGYVHEHTVKSGNGNDVHMLVMWRQSCKWINTE